MAKVTITALRPQTGDYGRVRAHEPINVDEKLADKLVKNRCWVKGLTPEAKRRAAAVAERRTAEAAGTKPDGAAKKSAAKTDGEAEGKAKEPAVKPESGAV